MCGSYNTIKGTDEHKFNLLKSVALYDNGEVGWQDLTVESCLLKNLWDLKKLLKLLECKGREFLI